MASFGERLQHAWNAFFNKDPTDEVENYYISEFDSGSYMRPDRFSLGQISRTTISSNVYNRIALDVSSIPMEHVKVDENNRYKETKNTGLNGCLTLSANADQTGPALIHDIVMSMFDEGVVAVVPIDTTINPRTGSFDIQSLRVGKILKWLPDAVKVKVYNEITGKKQDLIVPKRTTAIIENPFYAIMNEPNSLGKRLNRKLSLLDITDEDRCSGKLNILIQLPYSIKNENKRRQAENRRKELETQLASSKYGIGYVDSTEKITQINGNVENGLLDEIKFYTEQYLNQLGITKGIFDGSATEDEINLYQVRIVEPVLNAITTEFTRKFISKTAYTQGQRIMGINDPFKFVTTNKIAEIADKFTRNEILTSNEVRQIIGTKPADDPNADVLRNKNVSLGKDQQLFDKEGNTITNPLAENQNQNKEIKNKKYGSNKR